MIRVNYTCKHCNDEFEVEVTIGEEDDLPEFCPNCNAPTPDSAHEQVYEDAISKAESRAEDDR